MNLSVGKQWGIRRLADERGIFKMTAVDQRPPIKNPIAAHLGVEQAPWEEVTRFKRLLVEKLQHQSTAMLLDPHYAVPGCFDILAPNKGLIVTLEDSVFDEQPGGRLSANINDWTVGKIKRMAADAVKVLAWYRPDADTRVVQQQQDYVKRVGEQCAYYDIPFLFELLVYPLASDSEQTQEYIEMKNKKTDQVLESVAEFAKADYGVDIFKLESPVNADDADGSAQVQKLFDEMGTLADRPWVMLSAGAGKDNFRRVLEHAFAAGASGFLAGRAIWLDAFRAYPDWDQISTRLETDAVAYMQDICQLADSEATDWTQHNCYSNSSPADAGADFRHYYSDIPEIDMNMEIAQ